LSVASGGFYSRTTLDVSLSTGILLLVVSGFLLGIVVPEVSNFFNPAESDATVESTEPPHDAKQRRKRIKQTFFIVIDLE
jgi:hypothetical protein